MTTLFAAVVLIIPGIYNDMIRGRVELLRVHVRKRQSSLQFTWVSSFIYPTIKNWFAQLGASSTKSLIFKSFHIVHEYLFFIQKFPSNLIHNNFRIEPTDACIF